jgi:hypothetical protein
MNTICQLKREGMYVSPHSPLQSGCRHCGECQPSKTNPTAAKPPAPRPKPALTAHQREAAAIECRRLEFQNARLREQVAQRERLVWRAKHGDSIARVALALVMPRH